MGKGIGSGQRICALALALMLSLAGGGCGSSGQEENSEHVSQINETERAAKTGTLSYGYFYEEDGILLSSGKRFLYADWDPVEFDYICTDPTCSHRSSGCGARAVSDAGSELKDFSVIYQDRLIIVHAYSEIVVNESAETVEDWSRVYQTDVYEADLDGGSRRKMASFQGAIYSPNLTYAAVLVDGRLYFGGPTESRSRYETGEESAGTAELQSWTNDAVYCINLNDYTVETFAVMENKEGTAYQSQFYEYDGMIYAIISSFQDDRAVWYRIDPALGECEEILRFDSNVARFQGAIGDTVYYCYENSGQTLYARDIAPEAEEREIMTVSGEDMSASAFVLGDRILFQTDRVLEEGDRMAEYAVLDRDGNLLDTIHFDDYVSFLDVIGDRLIYFRVYSDCEEWWVDKADLTELIGKGVQIGPFFGVKQDTLAD